MGPPLALFLVLASAGVSVPFDARHVRLELSFDEARRSIQGRATETVRLLRDGVTSLDLDADEMRILAVTGPDGRPISFEARPPHLRVFLDPPHHAGDDVTFAVDYAAVPRRGVYFGGPDAQRPRLPRQVWSHSWPEDARYWFPCHDDLADKITSEIILTTPARYQAVANGDLVETHETSGRKVWHWKMDRPHSTYLMSFVTGEYDEVRDEATPGHIPLSYFVYRGRSADARSTFGRTPEMLRFFAEVSGSPYPFTRFSQAIASDFLFGGMENVTAVTLGDEALLEPRARIDTFSDGVISHELAHQWWGDAVSPRQWADVWLSEGFATFFSRLWQEHDLGPDAASYQRLLDTDDVLALDPQVRDRPMVFGDVEDPGVLLNANVYQKGGLVLGMLRRVMGDEAFWRGLRDHLARFAFGSADTADFRRSMEAAAGRDLGWFFDEWLMRPGLPHLTTTHRWDEPSLRLLIRLQQKPEEAGAIAFILPLDLKVVTAAGVRTEVILLERAEQEFAFPCPERPVAVTVDPDAWVPKTLVAEATAEELGVRLHRGVSAAERAVAARELARVHPPGAGVLLTQALATDVFWGIRSEAADALGLLGADSAGALRAGLRDSDPRVRAAVAKALGRLPPALAEALLTDTVTKDASELTVAAALRSLGTLRYAGAFETLARALARDSHAERVRIAALDGLGSLRNARGVPLALEQAAPGRASALRVAAVHTLRDLGRNQKVVSGRLASLLEDRDPKVREAAAEALGVLGDARTRGRLREALGVEGIPAVRRAMDQAVKRIEG